MPGSADASVITAGSRRDSVPGMDGISGPENGTVCEPCRTADLCVTSDRPVHGTCRCQACAKRSYERSDHFRSIPMWETIFTVIEFATGACYGPFDSEAEAGPDSRSIPALSVVVPVGTPSGCKPRYWDPWRRGQAGAR